MKPSLACKCIKFILLFTQLLSYLEYGKKISTIYVTVPHEPYKIYKWFILHSESKKVTLVHDRVYIICIHSLDFCRPGYTHRYISECVIICTDQTCES